MRALLVSALVVAGSVTAQSLPDARVFHDHLWRVIDSYPTDGTHTYYWPKKGGWAGVTRDLDYGDERVASGDAKGRCYCCGLTFEVFFRAWESWCQESKRKFRIADLRDAAAIRKLRLAWFGADGNRRTLQNAIVAHGLGFAIERQEDARPGDFVQLWRRSGSGHSVVFVDWVREDGEIVGLRYWSTQKSTDGIGERVERFGGEKGVDPEQLYIARVGEPTKSLRFYEAGAHDADELASRLAHVARRCPDVVGLRGTKLPDEEAVAGRFPGFAEFERSEQHLVLLRRDRVEVVDAAAGKLRDLRTRKRFTVAKARARTAGLTAFGALRLRVSEWREYAPTERGSWNEIDLLRR